MPLNRLVPLICLFAVPAMADPVALVVANGDYEARGTVDVDAVTEGAAALEGIAADVTIVENARRGALRRALTAAEAGLADADAMAIVLAGQFLHTGAGTWFLPVTADPDSAIDLAFGAVPVASILTLLSGVEGPAILALAVPEGDIDVPRGATAGLGDLTVPQGVTVVAGAPDAIGEMIETTLAVPGASLPAAAEDRPGVTIQGFLRDDLSFLPAATDGRDDAPDGDADNRLWALARAENTREAYELYIERFPDGDRADQARARLDEISEAELDPGEAGEQALDLNQEARQGIQRGLVLLGFDTRGIDGIFGPGTRGAIRGWQETNGFEATGYITREQIARLSEQADARAVELEAEQQRRQAELRAAEEAAWKALDRRDAQALRGFLVQYPDGRFAERARQRLADLGEAAVPEDPAAERERQIWRAVRQQNTAQGYRDYIAAFPDGRFVDEANAAIASLDGQGGGGQAGAPAEAPVTESQRATADSGDAAAQAAENALGLAPLTRRAIEVRLSALDLDPGTVDGQFDDATRRALRQFQQSAGLPVTGYVSQATAVRLLADAIRDVLDN